MSQTEEDQGPAARGHGGPTILFALTIAAATGAAFLRAAASRHRP